MPKTRPNKKTYGNQTTTASIIDNIKRSVIVAVATQVLLSIVGVLLPQFAAVIYVGYFVYKYGAQALALKKDYDEMEGEPEEKATKLAIREGFKAGIGAAASEIVGKPVSELVSESVHTTTECLSSDGTFENVARAIGKPDEEDLLRDFYMTTIERVANAVYDGVQDSITDYIARRTIND